MRAITLKLQKLTAESFSQFGEVISTASDDFLTINDGFARKYSNLASVDASAENGKATLHIFVAKKRQFPLTISMLEKHPFFSQAFIPRENQPFIVVVAPPGDQPNIEKIKAFITNGEQGINYARGVWHHPLISLENEMQFIVVDRKHNAGVDTIEQCVVFSLEESEISISRNEE